MLGFFPVSADAVSGEGAAPGLSVRADALAGTPVADFTLAVSGVDGTGSASSLWVGRGLELSAATGAVGSLAPSISVPFSAYTDEPFGLTVSLGSEWVSALDKYWGFKFTTGGAAVTVSALGRWRFSGNAFSHSLYLYRYVNGAGGDVQLATVTLDMSVGPAGVFVWGPLGSPVILSPSTTYYIISLEPASSGEHFAGDGTSFSSLTPYIGTVGGSVATFDLGSIGDAVAGEVYGPVNFEAVTAASGGLEAGTTVGGVLTGGITLDGVIGTSSADTAAVSDTASLSGNSSAASVGAVELPGTVAATGIASTSGTGTVGSAELIILSSGVAGTAAAGTIGIGTANFLGISSTASVGSVSAAGVTRRIKGLGAEAFLSPLLLPLFGGTRIRWVGHRILVDGTDMVFGLSGPMTVESGIDIGRNTMGFHLSDSAWPAAGNLWGNKPVEAYLSLADNPRKMDETKVFTGFTYQKKDTAGTPTETGIVCADGSAAYTGIPVCYSLGAYSGKRRDEILVEVADTVGVTLSSVPVGGIVNKPVTLNNADLLQFITDFGLVENWYPHVDRNGNLSVRVLNEPSTGWLMNAASGDFDLDSLQETYPTRPPCRWYVTGSQAVLAVVDDESGDPQRITTVQVDEEEALYNPKCRRSVDPSGHSLPAAELMVIARVTTEITTVAGDEVLRVTTTESFYNPASYDPNHDTYPAGTDYSQAYTDNSFHRDAVESLMETSKVTVTTVRDDTGTVLSQHTETMGWYSPQTRIGSVLPYRPEQIISNGPYGGGFIYGDGKAHIDATETYRIISIVDTTYVYDATKGTLLDQISEVQGWTAPESPCDVLVTFKDWGFLGSARVSNAGELDGGIGFYADSGEAWADGTDVFADVHFLIRRDFKWGERDWRSQETETLQLMKRVSTRYTVTDGQVTSTKETTEQFVKIQSGMNAQPQRDAPPYLFADGNWYEGPATFTTSGVKFTHYEKFGSTGNAQTTYSVNLVTGEVSIDAPVYSDGGVPLAPTIGSSLRWARVPIVSEIELAGCEFVDSKANLDLPWAENMDDLNRAGARAAQRSLAIIRELDCAWNPLVEPGDGLLLTSTKHGINSEWHIITEIKASVEIGADMHITAEKWPAVTAG